MRPKTQSFEKLYQQYKQELLEDKKSLKQIELRLENKQAKSVLEKQKHLT